VRGAIIDAGADGEAEWYRHQAHHRRHGAAFVAAQAPHLAHGMAQQANDVCHRTNPSCYGERVPKQLPKPPARNASRRALWQVLCREIPKDDVKLLSDETLLGDAAFCENADQILGCLLTI